MAERKPTHRIAVHPALRVFRRQKWYSTITRINNGQIVYTSETVVNRDDAVQTARELMNGKLEVA